MTDMTPEKRQMMQEMIELAAKDQQKQSAWIGDLHKKRLQNAQNLKAKHQQNKAISD